MAGKLMFCLAVWAVAAPTVAIAQTSFQPFIDDFEDGNRNDRRPVSWVGAGTINHGAYVVRGGGSDSEWAYVDGLSNAADLSIRTQIHLVSSGTGMNSMGVWAHSTAGQGSYWGVIDTMGMIFVGVKDQTLGSFRTDLDPRTTDIALQFDVKGRSLSMRAWRVGDAKPNGPQLTKTSPIVMPPGYLGLSVNLPANITVEFEYFELAPLEEPPLPVVPFFPFMDDFADGAVNDDTPVSIVSGGLPTTIEIADGDMVLTEPFQLDGFSLGLTTVQLDGHDVLSGDVSAQAVVRVSDEFAFAGIGMREQTTENGGDGGAYFGNIRGDGLITTGSFTGETLTLETPLDPVNTDVALQVDAINDSTGGARVIATAWAADKPSEKYSVTFVDSVARPAGFMGQSFGRGGEDATGVFAIFRSLEVLEAVAPPALRIEPAIVLSWPIDADGYVLEGTNDVTGPWNEIDADVIVEGSESTVTLRANQQGGFYRLQRR